MKLRFQKDALVNGINIVLKAVPSKTTMSILECILIDASGSEIKLTGNDMELGIETKVAGEILEHGKIALDAKLFSEITRRAVSYTHLTCKPAGVFFSLIQFFFLLATVLNYKIQCNITP